MKIWTLVFQREQQQLWAATAVEKPTLLKQFITLQPLVAIGFHKMRR
jgi:hypothetical protein